ncbi:Alpha/Beta hydrolase protein [Leptodontidium sp. MPI-SDFR-AT-0119]|nr:Alpha/Beta hydrolase protein [Leptodontidium sp. MPI-SDFR-AT-0119]
MVPQSVGIFENTVGFSYRTGAIKGNTGPEGQFQYIQGDVVTFSIGPLKLGESSAKPRLSVLDLVEDPSLSNSKLLNRARLLFSLTPGIGFERPICIDEKARIAISKYATEINLDAENPADLDTVLQKLGSELGLVIKSIPHIRNHIRRALAGFKVLRDIQIPVRDGNYVLGDIYLASEGKFPALVSSTVYGKRVVYSGPVTDDPNDVAVFESLEDTFFSTSDNSALSVPYTGAYFENWTKQRDYENISHFNTFFWVPRGYAMVKIDPRGVGQTPGKRGVLVSEQEANDLFDAVEWAAKQSWCTGNVALAGNSYGANCQWRPVIQKPKGLKAFFPYGTELDLYRDFSYMGGVPMFKFIDVWTSGLRGVSPRWPDEGDIVKTFSSHPFYDDYWSGIELKVGTIDIPVFLGAAQMLMFHQRAPYEAWRRVTSKDKYLQIVDTNYYSWPNREAAHKLWLFAERYLKGIIHEDLERVGMQMRIGHGEWYWRTEADWEVPGTEYIDWHFQADGALTQAAPSIGTEIKTLSYSADIESKLAKTGVSFVSWPFEKDIELAGHFTATLNISSTSHDADVVVSLWAIDENGNVVKYCVGPNKEPFASGLLRASHRKTDPKKDLPWRPWHTHTKEAHAPLKDGEVVEVNVEICPATARIRAGWRLRVDILPTETQPDISGFKPTAPRSWDSEFHDGAMNSLHLGGQFQNWIKLPVVPLKEIGALNVVP